MAIERYDLTACIGCRNCINICPMDVFRFDETAMKSIIAYPENCQACGMCYYACLGSSLQVSVIYRLFRGWIDEWGNAVGPGISVIAETIVIDTEVDRKSGFPEHIFQEHFCLIFREGGLHPVASLQVEFAV